MKKASAIVTIRWSELVNAAIIADELGIPALWIGGNATAFLIKMG